MSSQLSAISHEHSTINPANKQIMAICNLINKLNNIVQAAKASIPTGSTSKH